MTVSVLLLAARHAAALDDVEGLVRQAIQASGVELDIIEQIEDVSAMLATYMRLLVWQGTRSATMLRTLLQDDEDSSVDHSNGNDQLDEHSPAAQERARSASVRRCSSSSRSISDDANTTNVASSINPADGEDLPAEETTMRLRKKLQVRERKIRTLTTEVNRLQSSLQQVEAEQEQFLEDVQHMKTQYDKLLTSHHMLLWEYLPARDPALGAIPRLNHEIAESHESIGDYKLEDMLGMGQYAVVYATTMSNANAGATAQPSPTQHSQSSLAIKSIDKSKLIDLVALQRVNNEIAALQDPAIRHPGLLAITDVIHTQRHLYLVTERGGRDLFESFSVRAGEGTDTRPIISEHEIKRVIRRVALAVQMLHRHDYCHRDLKPENILYTPTHEVEAEVVKLVDFGLCTKVVTAQDAMLHDFCGSPGFFAPEILLCERYDGKKADVWSLGCVLLELVLGNDRFADLWVTMYAIETLRDHARFAQLVTENLAAVHAFSCSDQWTYSSELRALLLAMLQQEPTCRVTIDDTLSHPWLRSEQSHHPQVPSEDPSASRSPTRRGKAPRILCSAPPPSSSSLSSAHATLAPLARRPISADQSTPTIASSTPVGSPASHEPFSLSLASPVSSPGKKQSTAKVSLPSLSPDKAHAQRGATVVAVTLAAASNPRAQQ